MTKDGRITIRISARWITARMGKSELNSRTLFRAGSGPVLWGQGEWRLF
ncbi:hypothetical protein LQG66_31630 [Bradyrhizobium ontarionense]|uniref:Uncharacterized protein n=1 Tax=Bradyrhizobium ontarionense TaxID=2898149 RepID=A0ABY3R8S8_9BRAD|nr:hypothetical protein [Bradyrhizobium sp. A19]UFZ03713.1 hypothetical protein LQG66_31630 [Bradyrhizobium sp. A19]